MTNKSLKNVIKLEYTKCAQNPVHLMQPKMGEYK